jgi:hypothetical protein
MDAVSRPSGSHVVVVAVIRLGIFDNAFILLFLIRSAQAHASQALPSNDSIRFSTSRSKRRAQFLTNGMHQVSIFEKLLKKTLISVAKALFSVEETQVASENCMLRWRPSVRRKNTRTLSSSVKPTKMLKSTSVVLRSSKRTGSLEEQRRQSLAMRNEYALKQRQGELEMTAKQQEEEHQSFELKRAA